MARPLRLEFPGAFYHVTSRGNARASIYEGDADRDSFLDVLAKTVSRFGWVCHAYCLMDNHYHLLIETPEPNLSRGMRQLNGIYTQRYNRRHGRVGHMFQGRFMAIVVDRDGYLLTLCRYIVLNPLRAAMVKRPEQYPWSSYRATAGLTHVPTLLTTDWVLSQFGHPRRRAQERYQSFVLAGIQTPSPWGELRGQVLLGNDVFVARFQPYLEDVAEVKEVPRAQRLAHRPSLEALFAGSADWAKEKRDSVFQMAHLKHGYTLNEVSRVAGVHYTTVSKIVKTTKRGEGKK